MDLLIPDSWLREFVKTDATNKEIAKYLSFCGPSVEKTTKTESGDVYSIEITTNRMDTASVYGTAREAIAILPRFKKKAKLAPIEIKNNYKFVNRVKYLNVNVDPKLCSRFTAVLIKNVKIAQSPQLIQERLTASGIRLINNIVDISNYIMLELGQPVHTFDYDKIKKKKMILRESKNGEKVITLDDKKFALPRGDIVIEDGDGRIIDLCGIMGGKLSSVDAYTKNVLLFVQTYDPAHIRKTSMALAQRTMAASLFEKGIDSEFVKTGILRAIDMFIKLTKGSPEKEILDIYPNPYKQKVIKITLDQINKKLGIEISKIDISKILTLLNFTISWSKNELQVVVPSFRASDINIPEDITEEIARIYGYQNLPSVIMSGIIPDKPLETPFDFENKAKDILKGYGGVEVYTLSLVSKQNTEAESLKLTNPLGSDSEYLRTSLMNSLIEAAKENIGEKEAFHLFEIANIYIPKTNNLPEEKMILAGIFANTKFRNAKGIVESLLNELNIKAEFAQEELKGFRPGQRIQINAGSKSIGQFGNLENNNYTYYEFGMQTLSRASQNLKKYIPIPQNPPQIEDLTLTFPPKTRIGEVMTSIQSINRLIENIELKDIYKDSYTFRIWYQDPEKTLTNEDVEKIRNQILQKIKDKFGGNIKN